MPISRASVHISAFTNAVLHTEWVEVNVHSLSNDDQSDMDTDERVQSLYIYEPGNAYDNDLAPRSTWPALSRRGVDLLQCYLGSTQREGRQTLGTSRMVNIPTPSRSTAPVRELFRQEGIPIVQTFRRVMRELPSMTNAQAPYPAHTLIWSETRRLIGSVSMQHVADLRKGCLTLDIIRRLME